MADGPVGRAMESVLVIDVGSHKAEEVNLLAGTPRFSARNMYRVLRWARYNPHRALQELKSIGQASQTFLQRFTPRFAMIEPVLHPELIKFVAETRNTILFNAVSSCAPSGKTILFMSDNSLGNSIIPTKPGLTGNKQETFNIDFAALYEFLVETFVRSGDCQKIVLRMNAEGVEGPIIDYVAHHASIKPDILAGSIGDIKKCFGEAAYNKAISDLAAAKIPYIYFTSSISTWSAGLKEITAALGRSAPTPEFLQAADGLGTPSDSR